MFKTKTTYYAANTDREFSAAWRISPDIIFLILTLLEEETCMDKAALPLLEVRVEGSGYNIQNIQFTFNQWNIRNLCAVSSDYGGPGKQEKINTWLNRTMIF
jgi:hypothetical protein